MSLPGSTIETLIEQHAEKTLERSGDMLAAMKTARDTNIKLHARIGELEAFVEKQKETIETLELAVATMRRRVESLEGVT
jgi:predicted RNase H-like nuclease (RuvC/YqgF family)